MFDINMFIIVILLTLTTRFHNFTDGPISSVYD